MSSQRDRVKALYEKYDPGKLPQLDATMKKYAGKEEAMIKALVKKYGPEPGAASAPPSAPPSAASTPAPTPREPPSGALTARDRVKALYEKYDPGKIPQLDATMKKYAGKEEAMIKALVKKYGPEPESVASTPAPTPTATPREEHSGAGAGSPRDRVKALYEKYDPGKLPQLDATMKKYAGKEEAMIKALVKKYGPEPGAASAPPSAPPSAASTPAPTPREPPSGALTPRDRVKALYEKYDPGKTAQLDATMKKYAGKEEALVKALVKKYGPEPGPESVASTPAPTPTASPREDRSEAASAAAPASPRDRVKALYEKYDPGKISQLDATMKKYAGKEGAMIKALVKKYGPEPESVASTPVPTPTATPRDEAPQTPDRGEAPAVAASPKDRARAIFQKYDPAKAGSVDAQLVKFAGKEEQYIRALVKKYGPEPTGDTTAATSAAATPLPTPRDAAPLSYADRARAMYDKYDPAKAGTAAAQLKKFAGKEEQYLKALVKKYGPEPHLGSQPQSGAPTPAAEESPVQTPRSSAPTSALPSSRPGTFEDRARAMYRRYDPAKEATVPAQLKKFAGKEEQYLKALIKKYGPEPQPEAEPEPAAPADDAPEPTPEPTPEATPEPTAEPTPEATPAMTPDATPPEPSTPRDAPASEPSAPATPRPDVTADAPTPTPSAPEAPAPQAAAPQAAAADSAALLEAQRRLEESEAKAQRTAERLRLQRRALAALRPTADLELRRSALRRWMDAAERSAAAREAAGLLDAGEWVEEAAPEAAPEDGQQGFGPVRYRNAVTGTVVPSLVELRLEARRGFRATAARPAFLRELLALVAEFPASSTGRLGACHDATTCGAVLDIVTEAHRVVTVVVPRLEADVESLRTDVRTAELSAAEERATTEAKARDLAETEAALAAARADAAEREAEAAEERYAAAEARAQELAMKDRLGQARRELAEERRGVPSALEQQMEAKDELVARLQRELGRARVAQRQAQADLAALKRAEDEDRLLRTAAEEKKRLRALGREAVAQQTWGRVSARKDPSHRLGVPAGMTPLGMLRGGSQPPSVPGGFSLRQGSPAGMVGSRSGSGVVEPPVHALPHPPSHGVQVVHIDGDDYDPLDSGPDFADGLASPAPQIPAHMEDEEAASSSDSDAASGRPDVGLCMHCRTALTPFDGSRVGAACDGDKVAFCFSCRRSYTARDLEVRDVRLGTAPCGTERAALASPRPEDDL